MGQQAETFVQIQNFVLAIGAFALVMAVVSLFASPWLPPGRRARLAKRQARRGRCPAECRINLASVRRTANDMFAMPDDVFRAYRVARAVMRRLQAIGEYPEGLGMRQVEFLALVQDLRERCELSGMLKDGRRTAASRTKQEKPGWDVPRVGVRRLPRPMPAVPEHVLEASRQRARASGQTPAPLFGQYSKESVPPVPDGHRDFPGFFPEA